MRIVLPVFLAAVIPSVTAEGVKVADTKLEVVSVRVLSDKEAADRTQDFIGPSVAVRLRLSCDKSGVYFFSHAVSVIPIGNRVRWNDQGQMVWLSGREELLTSPGVEKAAAGIEGAWHSLYSHSAIEWEELDSTVWAGQKRAFTVFLKKREKDPPTEVVSESYVVPSGPEGKKSGG